MAEEDAKGLPIVAEGARCTGHCCRRFTLPWSMDDLQDKAERIRAFNALQADADINFTSDGPAALNEKGKATLQNFFDRWGSDFFLKFFNGIDLVQIAEMVVYLGQASMEGVMDGGCGEDSDYIKKIKHHYTCKNLVGGTDCNIYADRPAMCRDYPYGSSCDYIGCTDSSARRTPASERPS